MTTRGRRIAFAVLCSVAVIGIAVVVVGAVINRGAADEHVRAAVPIRKGDTLIVDLDLSTQHLPAGVRVQVGEAVVEISDVENDACAKFAQHYGADVFQWIRAGGNREKRLRGLFARVISGGWVRDGDAVRVVR